jgi:hypothetical protein
MVRRKSGFFEENFTSYFKELFLAWLKFDPEDGANVFFRNVRSDGVAT